MNKQIEGSKFTLIDPTFIFLFGVIISVLFVKGNEKDMSLTVSLPSVDTIVNYFNDLGFLIMLIVALFGYICVIPSKAKLTYNESLVANWYLWNCVLVHVGIDGLCGGFGYLSLMNDNYKLLDRRFRYELIDKPNGPSLSDAAGAKLVVNIEITMHSVLTFLAYIGVCYKKPWRQGVELIALTFQLFGALLFVGPELYTGCENLVPIGVKTCFPGFSLYEIFYFWFGVLVNGVWVVVPAFMMYTAIISDVKEKEGKSIMDNEHRNGNGNGKKVR